jgi:hypothetical protein
MWMEQIFLSLGPKIVFPPNSNAEKPLLSLFLKINSQFASFLTALFQM